MEQIKQTAVEFLLDNMHYSTSTKWQDIIEQAKAMEKEQMDKVSEDWFVEGLMHIKDNKRIYQSFEHYYNETYGK